MLISINKCSYFLSTIVNLNDVYETPENYILGSSFYFGYFSYIFFTLIFFGVALLLFFLENHKFSSYLLCSLLFLYFRRNINFCEVHFSLFLEAICARRE